MGSAFRACEDPYLPSNECILSRLSVFLSKRAVQLECCADQGEMGKSLWKVSKCFAAAADFLCVEPHVIGITQHAFKEQSRFHEFSAIDTPRSSQCFHEPERAYIECAFSAMEAIDSRFTVVPIDQAV